MASLHDRAERWPALPLADWADTCDTLHLWTQVVGKVKLDRCPFLNEWWQVAFQLTPRGMTTGDMPDSDRTFAIDFDFVAHQLVLAVSDGQRRTLPLVPRTVADFYHEVLAALRTVGIRVHVSPMPAEIPDALPFDQDRIHAAYDPEPVRRWLQIQLQAERVLQRFRSDFVGKSSPIQFFWGSFDLSATRFSGRAAPLPTGVPRFVQLAEDQENYACGFWPGNTNMAGVTHGEPAFYAYLYPEPPGYRDASVQPPGAAWNPALGEFVLSYEAVRRARDPEQALLTFFQSTYEVGASLARWDRASLERPAPIRSGSAAMHVR